MIVILSNSRMEFKYGLKTNSTHMVMNMELQIINVDALVLKQLLNYMKGLKMSEYKFSVNCLAAEVQISWW